MKLSNIVFVVLLSVFCNGCSMILTYAGATPATVSATQTIDTIKLGVDAVTATQTGKTTTDIAVGVIAGKECKSTNVLEKKSYCE